MLPFVIRRPSDNREIVVVFALDAASAVSSAAEDFCSGRPVPEMDEIVETQLEVRRDGAKRWRLFTVEARVAVQYTAYDEDADKYDEDDWDNDYSDEEEE